MGFARINARRISIALLVILAIAVITAWGFPKSRRSEAPARIVGPSMSPTLWGPSVQACCATCGWQHRVHLTPDPRGRTFRCFRCGELSVKTDTEVTLGDQVEVDFNAYLHNTPQRGDLVAVEKKRGSWEVKRLVALPQDRVRIDSEGTLWVNAKRSRIGWAEEWNRSPELYREPSHTHFTFSRWKPVAFGDVLTNWARTDRGWNVNGAKSYRDSRAAWLVYDHINIHASNQPDVPRDDQPANLALSRTPRPVFEFRLELQVVPLDELPQVDEERGNLNVAFYHPTGTRLVEFPLPHKSTTYRLLTHGSDVWLLNEQHEATELLTVQDVSTTPVTSHSPVGLQLSNDKPYYIAVPWLGRGLRFDPPADQEAVWRSGFTVPQDHYIVLGDNPTNSVDSRAHPQGITKDRLWGRVSHSPQSSREHEEL